MSNRMKLASGVALVVAAVVLFVVLQGGDDDSEAPPQQASKPAGQGGGKTEPKPPPAPVVRVAGGEPVGGVQRIEVESGERARFVVRSDSAIEVHLHGYDITREVPDGGATRFDFPADLEGGFELEVHHGPAGEVPIADLVVSPG